MSDKEMVVYKSSFISKVSNFFRRIFKRNFYKSNIQAAANNNGNISRELFLNDIKVENLAEESKESKKIKFLKEIDGNVEMLNTLSIEKLRKLEKYYNHVIEENDNKIKKLKANS